LSVAAGEASGVIPGAEATDAEVVCRRNLIVIVAEKDEEILELHAGAFQRVQIGHAITSRQKIHANGICGTR